MAKVLVVEEGLLEGEALTEKRSVADWSGEAEGTAVTAGELLALREACGEPD